MVNHIAIAGAGAMAQALGKALGDCGMRVTHVASRNAEHARSAATFVGASAIPYSEIPAHASRVIVVVSDRAIPEVAAEIAENNGGGLRIALHTCGAYGAEVLAPLTAQGVSCGAIHPLQTVRDPDKGAAALRIATYAVCGDAEALGWAEDLAGALSGRAIHIDADARAPYHAAAVMASNYLVAILDAAQQLMELAGVPRAEALRSLAPLVRTTMENVFDRGPVEALTGPVARGDAATVARHLDAIQLAGRSIVELYEYGGLHALDIARRRGLAKAEADAVREALARE